MAAKPAADKASEEAFASLDIGGYNYAASRYEIDKDLHPNRVIVGSETLPKKSIQKLAACEKASLCDRRFHVDRVGLSWRGWYRDSPIQKL